MKKLLLFLIFSIGHFADAQTLEWAQVFQPHSEVALAGITPSSVVLENGNSITTIVETDTLRLQSFNVQGETTAVFSTDRRVREFTNLIKTSSGGTALVYESQMSPPLFYFLETDENLGVLRHFPLSIPENTPDIQHLFQTESGDFLLSLFGFSDHQMYQIQDDESVAPIYSGPVFSFADEKATLLPNGNLLFTFGSGSQLLRCISPDGTVLWNQTVDTGSPVFLEYEAVVSGTSISTVALQRSWVGGSPNDVLRVSRIDMATGEIQQQTVLFSASCFLDISDFKYNPVTGKLLVSVVGCLDGFGIHLVEIDPGSHAISNQQAFTFTDDPLEIGETSEIFVMPSGKVVLLTKSHVSESEKGNIFLSVLDENLMAENTLEINLDPPSGSESSTDIHVIGDSKILLTGIVPNSDPFIFWEEVQYFNALVDFGGLGIGENQMAGKLSVYPNPTRGKARIASSENITSVTLLNNIGQEISAPQMKTDTGVELDLDQMQSGVYLLRIAIGTKTETRRIIVN